MFGLKHVFLLGLVASSGALPPTPPAAGGSSKSPSNQTEECQASSIVDYVVSLKPGLSEGEAKAHFEWLKTLPPSTRSPKGPQRIYHFGRFRGYSANLDDETVKKIESRKEKRRKRSEYISYHIDDKKKVKSVRRNQLFQINSDPQWMTQDKPPWGLRDISPSRQGNKDQYTYDPRAGNGTFGYVFDTGINSLHEDFGTRVIERICLADECERSETHRGRSAADISGHGTHVAGTIGGTKYGVAKQTQLIDVRIFKTIKCLGMTSVLTDAAAIQQALAWTMTDVVAKGRQGRAVINFSVGPTCPPYIKTFDGCKNYGLNWGVGRLFSDAFNAGILPVVSAGNEGLPAEWSTPRAQHDVLTVGALDRNHQEAGFSNYGPAVDILAPGVDVESAHWKNPLGSTLMDGTSMATPHVTGMVLYLLSISNNTIGPKQLKQTIIDMASDDVTVLNKGTTGRGQGKETLQQSCCSPNSFFSYCTEAPREFVRCGWEAQDGPSTALRKAGSGSKFCAARRTAAARTAAIAKAAI
ncbi:putative subtilisin-like protease [Ophiocordyceps polyrhachis-furcata BCC 54312]|uniref:Subtilisin-like protease n=1 Tax=Ophiocordyceps polyrhachis-furcata BCC 54312 TaxID=1330021 RepID=A0A367L7K7_9HYPO|nr:putative subtilisin-like protease [Ophiocordyceps polyrhachis-furcata BCC 54312]